MKQLFIMLVLDGGCRVAVAFYGGGGDAASAGQEVRNHWTTLYHTTAQYHRNHTLPLCRSGRYHVIPQVYCTVNKKIPKLYHNVCFILYHIWPRGQKASGWPALPSLNLEQIFLFLSFIENIRPAPNLPHVSFRIAVDWWHPNNGHCINLSFASLLRPREAWCVLCKITTLKLWKYALSPSSVASQQICREGKQRWSICPESHFRSWQRFSCPQWRALLFCI